MIEEAKELMEDIKDKVGEKGFYFIIFALVGVGIYLVIKSNNESEYFAPTGVTGYPTVEENADVVMDSMNNTLESTIGDFASSVNSRFEYLENIYEELENNINSSTGEIINNSNQNTNDIISNSNQNTNSIISNSNQNTQTIVNTSNQNREEVITAVTAVNSRAATINNTENETQNVVTYTTKSGLNTNTSIVDALKAAGQDSSFEARQKLAAQNGISNYTGSYEQNVALLNKMKSGNLVTTSSGNKNASASKPVTTQPVKKTSTTSSSNKSNSSSSSSSQKLNTSTSIVDALKAQGKDSSFAARKRMAESMGISNYTGTAAQNRQLLNSL